MYPNDVWDDKLWTEFRTEYSVDPTAPGLNQAQFSQFRRDMSEVEQMRREEFAKFDADGDGFLNRPEMAVVAAALFPVSHIRVW